MLFHSSDFMAVGAHYADGTVDYCCTQRLYDEGSCKALGRAIVRSNNVKYYKSGFPVNGTTARMHETFFVKDSGVHYLYFANCDRSTSNVYINGFSEWRNPYGYLPGQFYGLLPVGSSLSSRCAPHHRLTTSPPLSSTAS